MASELSMSERYYLVGRMLQVQPEAAVLQAFCAAYPGFELPDAEEVEQDYLRLFVGLGMPIAPPWESAWASDARLLFQRETLDVRYWYRSAGMEAEALHREPDDHIGLELEFIGALLDRGEDERAATFAREHPRAWAGRWSDAVQEHATTAFYRTLAWEAVTLLEQL